MRDRLIMPNHIIIKDGLACGDRVTLMYDFDDDKINFNMISNGCKCCEKMCRYLQSSMSGKSTATVVSICNEIEKSLRTTRNLDGLTGIIKSKRVNCYLAPIQILKECASERREDPYDSNEKIDLYVDKLDCDACATRENVSWLYQKPRHIHGQYSISAENRKMLMRMGRLNIDDIKYTQALDLYKNLGEDEFEFMEEYKLMPMVYQNFKKLGVLDFHDERWRLLIYQYQRTVVAESEIEKIDCFIKDKNLKAYWVKGAYTKKIYIEKNMRNLTDFDLLVLDEDDAFQVVAWLLKNDYNIFPDSFSLKRTIQGESISYTGHLHFQKIINLQYRLIVDVNFTGFPMIKVASYVPRVENNHIALESMIVVALCHLFKHKEVFLKDINDLYIMLTRNDYDVKILIEEIEKNGLEDLFSVVLKYLAQEYPISDEAYNFHKLSSVFQRKMNAIELQDWPYNVDDVKRIKIYYFNKYIKEKVDSKRIYLYPIVILKNISDLDKIIENIQKTNMENCEYQIYNLTHKIFRIIIENIYYVITPVGIFLEMKEFYVEAMKKDIRRQLWSIINAIDIEIMDIPYAIAFEEKWLDNRE